MFLISAYNYRGDLISETEIKGTRKEATEAAAEYCRQQGGVFYYIQETKGGEVVSGGFEQAEIL